jgi:hypothetical protein
MRHPARRFLALRLKFMRCPLRGASTKTHSRFADEPMYSSSAPVSIRSVAPEARTKLHNAASTASAGGHKGACYWLTIAHFWHDAHRYKHRVRGPAGNARCGFLDASSFPAP